MRQALEQNREQLITHLEQKLQQLKLQRDTLLQPETVNHTSKVKVADYLAGKHPQPVPSQLIAHQDTLDRAEVFRQRETFSATKKRAVELEQLIRKKKELSVLGITEQEPQKINRLHQSKANPDKVAKAYKAQKQKQQKEAERQRVVKEQLAHVQSFLQQKKGGRKDKMGPLHYSTLLNSQPKKLKRYQELVNKPKLTLVEQQELLQLSFNVIVVTPGITTKEALRKFLLANPSVGLKFSITKQEVMRDLSVFETQQLDYLTFNEFYQFMKSVQITNRLLKPNLTNQGRPQTESKKRKEKQQIKQVRPFKKQLEEYLRKLFTHLDLKKERVVERTKLIASIKKGILANQNNFPGMTGDILTRFAMLVEEQELSAKQKSYYKSLNKKYIGIQQLLYLTRSFAQKVQKAKQRQQQVSELQAQVDEGSVKEQTFETKLNKVQKDSNDIEEYEREDQRHLNDFQRYGWGTTPERKQQFNQLQAFDKHYRELADKHGNEIHWNGIEHYQQDFQRFNQCLKAGFSSKAQSQFPRFDIVPQEPQQQ